MKKSTTCLVLALSALALAAPASPAFASNSWSSERVQGNGTIKKQSRELAHFTGLAFGLPGKLELHIGNNEGIVIEADENLLPLIESVIEDGTLKIRTSKRNMNINAHTLKITVNAKTVERLALGGSGSIESDALKGSKMQFDLGGSGSINIKGIDGESVAVSVGGSGNLKSGPGSAKRASVSIGGSGDVNLGQLKVDDASVSVAGSGEALVAPRNTLSVNIVGSGDVSYYGNPTISKTVMGSGSIKKLGDSR